MATTGGIRAGKAFVELLADDSKLLAGLKRAQRMLAGFGARIAGLGAVTAAAGASMATPFLLASKVFQQTGDDLAKMALRTGVSVEALSELAYAAGQSGADVATLEKSVRKMQQTIIDGERGTSTAIHAFDQLGLSVSDLLALNPEQQFLAIGDALSSLADPTRKAAVAAAVFGRAGTQLLPLLQDGAAGVAALREEARRLGLTISTDAAKRAEVLGDRIDDVRRVVKAAAFQVGDALAPSLTAVAKSAATAAAIAGRFVKANKSVVVVAARVAGVVFAAGAAITAVGVAFVGLSLIVGGLVSVLSLASTAFAAVGAVAAAIFSPLGLAVTAVAALGAAVVAWAFDIKAALQQLETAFMKLVERFSPGVKAIMTAMQAGDIPAAAEVLAAEVNLAWTDMAVRAELTWQGMLDAIGQRVDEWALGIKAAVKQVEDAMRSVDTPVRKAAQSVPSRALSLTEQSNALGGALINSAKVFGRALKDETTAGLAEGIIGEALIGSAAMGKISRDVGRLQKSAGDAISDAAADATRESYNEFVDAIREGSGNAGGVDAISPVLEAGLRLVEAEARLNKAIAAAEAAKDSPDPVAGKVQGLADAVAGAAAVARTFSRGTFSGDGIRQLAMGFDYKEHLAELKRLNQTAKDISRRAFDTQFD